MLPLWLTKPAMKVWGWIMAILAFVGILAAALWQSRRRGAAEERLLAEEEREAILAENRAEASHLEAEAARINARLDAAEEARVAREDAAEADRLALERRVREEAEGRVRAAERGEVTVGDVLRELDEDEEG